MDECGFQYAGFRYRYHFIDDTGTAVFFRHCPYLDRAGILLEEDFFLHLLQEGFQLGIGPAAECFIAVDFQIGKQSITACNAHPTGTDLLQSGPEAVIVRPEHALFTVVPDMILFLAQQFQQFPATSLLCTFNEAYACKTDEFTMLVVQFHGR